MRAAHEASSTLTGTVTRVTHSLISKLILAMAACLLASGLAQAQVENTVGNFAGNSAGDWSGPGGVNSPIVGPPDGSCSNIGNVGSDNATFQYGFSIPGNATITDVNFFIKASAGNDPEDLEAQLAFDASTTPISLANQIGNAITIEIGTGNPNCASTFIQNFNFSLADWGSDSATVTPAVVNDPNFGLNFVTLESSSIKVDANCLEIEYTTPSGPATQIGCFTVQFTVNKDFTDDNPAEVEITLACNGADDITANPLMASEGNPAVFSVLDIDGGATCTATETSGLPVGYDNDESDCQQANLPADGGECTIVNTPNVPSMALTKTVTNTGSGPGGTFQAGDTVNYTMEVTNDGNVTLTNVVVSDPLLGLVNVVCSASLAPAASCQVMGSYLVTQDDIDDNGGGDGQIDNTATANSDQVGPEPASAEAQLVTQDPSFAVTKTVTNTGSGAGGSFQAGDTVNYTIEVTNDGNVTLDNVVVSDPLLGLTNEPCAVSLAPAATCQVMGSYLVTQGDIDDNGGGDGDIDNTATADSDQTGSQTVSAEAQLVTQNASFAVNKTVTNMGTGAGGNFQAGDTIEYTIEVTNNGNVTLDNVVVSDPLLGLTNEPCSASLAPAATCQVTGSYLVTQGDIDDNGGGDGDIDNTATADSDQTGSQTASAEAALAVVPDMTTTKTVTNTGTGPGGTFQAGDTINYTIDVTNDGTVTLDNVVVSDPLLGLTNELCAVTLAPAATCQVTGSYLVTQADIDDNGGGDGDIDNTATADSDTTGPESASAEAQLVGEDPSLVMAKTVTNTGSGPGGNFQAGDTVEYTMEATNDGNVTLTNVVVSDPLLGLTDEPCAASLAPAATCQVMGSYLVTQGDIDDNGGGDGDIDNTATADSDQSGPQEASAEAQLVTQDASLALTKTVTNTGSGAGGAFQPGDTIDYTIEVTNDGNVDLTNVVVSDPLLGLTNEPCSASLTTGNSCQVMGTYMVTQADLDNNGGGDGDIDNTAEADSDQTGPQTANAAAQLVLQNPDITLVKTADPTTYTMVGEVITYTFMVSNTGNLTLFNISVSDPLITDPPNNGTITCPSGNPIPSLAPGASESCSAEYTITEDDLLNGEVMNQGMVTADCSEPGRGESCTSDEDNEVVGGDNLTTFRVQKDFSDDNPAGVTVLIECNTGLPLQQQGVVHDPDAAGLEPGDFTAIEFVVGDFEPGTMDCDIEEVIPAGYLPTYTAGATTGIADTIFSDDEACHYELIQSGQFTCDIFNELQPVDVVVEKIWIDDNPEFQQSTVVEVTLECDAPITGGFQCFGGEGNGTFCRQQFIDPSNPGEFLVLPHFEGTTCSATEELLVGVLTDESDCEVMIVFPGQGDSCVIVNTRLFAGIPTLNQYGLILLALLMLGVGAVAYRRFV